MKKFKKADTFGQKGDWQINTDQLKEVYNNIKGQAGYTICEEEVEEVILALERLGYLELEK